MSPRATSQKFGFLQKVRPTTDDPKPAATARTTTRGRPAIGKRSDPAYRQLTVWVRETTHHQTKLALLQQGRGELSELVEELLTEWLKKPQKPARKS